MVQFSSLLGVAVSPKGNPAIFQCVCTFLQLTLFYSDHIRIVQAIFIQNSFCKVQRNPKSLLFLIRNFLGLTKRSLIKGSFQHLLHFVRILDHFLLTTRAPLKEEGEKNSPTCVARSSPRLIRAEIIHNWIGRGQKSHP